MLRMIKYLKSVKKLGIFPIYNIFRQIINKQNFLKKEGGQVLTEFTVMLVMFVGVALTLMLLLAIFTEYGWRMVSLVSLEYP